MKKIHQARSLNNFLVRVVGTNLEEQKINDISEDLHIRYDLSSQIDGLAFEYEVLSDKEKVLSGLFLINNKSSGGSLLERKVKEIISLVDRLCSNVYDLKDDELKTIFHQLNIAYSNDYGLHEYLFTSLEKVFKNSDLIAKIFVPISELLITLGKESFLFELVSKNARQLIDKEAFFENRENIRTLQQVLSVSSVAVKNIFPKMDGYDERQKDIILAMGLATSSSKSEFVDFCDDLSIQVSNTSRLSKSYFLEALKRSPVKINYLGDEFVLAKFFSEIDKDENYDLLFRSLYFLEEDYLHTIKSLDVVDILINALNFSDRRFSKMYQDVRRSFKIICTEEDIKRLIVKVNLSGLTEVKWNFLLGLLRPHISDEQKLQFLTKVLTLKGIDVINSEIALTLCASLGLKRLSSIIINDSIASNGYVPCLPELKNSDLNSIFEEVIDAGFNCSKSSDDRGLVSVIITTFNPNVDFLKYSLKSIVNQTYSNIEIILVDDCSNIDISSKIEEIIRSNEFNTITYLRNNKNLGQYVSRNIAIDLSQGEYIAIQDDDDVSHPQRIEAQLKRLSEQGVKMCFTKHVRFNDNGLLSIDDPRNLLVYGDGPASLLFSKDILSLTGGFKAFRTRGDIDFRTRVQSIIGKHAISHLDAPLYFMRSSLKTVSSLYEYTHGEKLLYLRKKIMLTSKKKALKEECSFE